MVSSEPANPSQPINSNLKKFKRSMFGYDVAEVNMHLIASMAEAAHSHNDIRALKAKLADLESKNRLLETRNQLLDAHVKNLMHDLEVARATPDIYSAPSPDKEWRDKVEAAQVELFLLQEEKARFVAEYRTLLRETEARLEEVEKRTSGRTFNAF